MFINNYRGKKGPEWDHVIIVEQKKRRTLRCRASATLYKSLAVQKCVKSLAIRPRTFWPDTDYRSYSIYKSCNLSLILQGKSETELGGAAVPCILTDACCKVQQTLKSSSNFDRTPNGPSIFVKMRGSLQTRTFGRTSN